MSRILLNTLLFTCAMTLAGTVAAEKSETPKGVEVSGDNQSDQGATHGKAYAGSKEKDKTAKKSKTKKTKKSKKTKDQVNSD